MQKTIKITEEKLTEIIEAIQKVKHLMKEAEVSEINNSKASNSEKLFHNLRYYNKNTANSSSGYRKEEGSDSEKRIQQKLECLRLATQKNDGDVLNQAKENFAWLIAED
ncbi:hypothetical protein B0A58_07270 [Flavobacterium branchiophilum NBRC 15030 = ATCC 35035]|uniref:Uncharacterized protein n=1 Tax=Flavobacterium branchiophilum TaxID=55197 RepID=A0A543G1A6_9FLAO|nr:hypothetical protein [Flavobacterium branchiophilum]OXA76366.1 hypothetical protein B0A58_07270 [Flavobacterium branchiophilum NBRC 15030 = ATCC 35035]TQM39814.1 hypothetical protein BC670_0646 [Flavobacterium branchiophilum]GEM55276.1 hypothetical protein FB1_14970 [Flavobacterium branchiophilum NBRC 15030 = ATCC 35035]